jgi:hypothetical protein
MKLHFLSMLRAADLVQASDVSVQSDIVIRHRAGKSRFLVTYAVSDLHLVNRLRYVFEHWS